MSLLKRLNERAKELSGQQSNVADEKSELKRRFAEETTPALKELEEFLRTLNQSLKAAKPEVRHQYSVPGYGDFSALAGFDWAIHAEAKTLEFTLEIKWKVRAETERAPRVTLSGYERIRMLNEAFKRIGLGGIRDEQRGPSGLATQAIAQATGFVNCKLAIRAHQDDNTVQFDFENVDQLAAIRRQLPANVLGSEVHDRLGEFLLRENDLFVRETWVRGLQPVARIPQKAAAFDVAPVTKQVNSEEESLESLINKFSTLPSGLATKPSNAPAQAAVTVPAPAAAPASFLDNADERELDFLAELKFAARYADSAVKKNQDNGGENGFGQERDIASLRNAYQRLQAEQSAKDLKGADKINAANLDPRSALDADKAREFLARMKDAKQGLEGKP